MQLEFFCFWKKKKKQLSLLRLASSFHKVAKKDKISGSSADTAVHKYLQVALVADEFVAARHGNNTADFLLVLANIVSILFYAWVVKYFFFFWRGGLSG